jgi:hypothetical protein
MMIDPSFVFSRDGMLWQEQFGVGRTDIVFSEWFDALLGEDTREATEALQRLVAPEDLDAYPDPRGRVRELVSENRLFKYDLARLQPPDDAVRRALLEIDGWVGKILADEWTYLQSNSLMVSKRRFPLDAFRDAGAVIVEFGRRLRDEMLHVVIPKPATRERDHTAEQAVRAAAKWIIVGGASVAGGRLGPPGALLGSVAVPVVRAFDA